MIRALVPALLFVLGAATPAHAFVRSRTGGTPGTPLHWYASYVFLQADSGGSPDLTIDQITTTLQTSMTSWNDTTGGCGYLKLMMDPPAVVEAHYDGINVLKFRTDRWCHPNDAQSHDKCYDAVAAAITTVFYVDHPGSAHHAAILDTDIQMNDIDFTFVIVTPGQSPTARPGTQAADLQNTLTHELGHVMGLDHTCKDAAMPANEVDESGNTPPPCNAIPAADRTKILTATMYNRASPGEIVKRVPKQDDISGICDAYPTAADPMVFSHTNLGALAGNGCSVAGRAPQTGALVLFLLAPFALYRRRRAAR